MTRIMLVFFLLPILAGCSSDNQGGPTLTGDFPVRYALDESAEANWRDGAIDPPYGPKPKSLALVGTSMQVPGMDEITWRQQRLVAALDYWIDQGLNYCHHHIPLWLPPDDAKQPAPVFRISNGRYSRTEGTTIYSQTCSPARRPGGAQIISDIPAGCPDTAANCIDPSQVQWKGLDCSDFTSWVYNFSFGVVSNDVPLPTGVGTQACNGEYLQESTGIRGKGGGILLDINYRNLSNLQAYLKPGDLLYILPDTKKTTDTDISFNTVVHVVVWTGKVWGDIRNDKAYYQEGDGNNFGMAGDRVGGDFGDYASADDPLNDNTPLIVDSHFAGPAYRPFLGWYRKHLSHVRRIINADAAKTDPVLQKLVFPDWGKPDQYGAYKTVSPSDSASVLFFNPANYDAGKNCQRITGFNP